jgi:hypothetical protein
VALKIGFAVGCRVVSREIGDRTAVYSAPRRDATHYPRLAHFPTPAIRLEYAHPPAFGPSPAPASADPLGFPAGPAAQTFHITIAAWGRSNRAGGCQMVMSFIKRAAAQA